MEHTMTICYCEDESAQAKAFAIKIDQWAKNKNTAVRTDLFEGAEEYLFKAEQNAYDVIFLDISMRGHFVEMKCSVALVVFSILFFIFETSVAATTPLATCVFHNWLVMKLSINTCLIDS